MKTSKHLLQIVMLIILNMQFQLSAQTLPYENSRFGIFGAYAANEYGYFKARMGFSNAQYWDWVNNHFQNLGAHWTRSNLQLVWDYIELTLDSAYNWNPPPFLTDSVIINVYKPGNQVYWLGVFKEGGLFGQAPPGSGTPLRDPLSDTLRYKRFVQSAVERYDGDGFQDVNPYVKVKYWQLSPFELGLPLTLPDSEIVRRYVAWIHFAAPAIRSSDPTAKIVLISQADGLLRYNPLLRSIISTIALEGLFDVVDVHHWGPAAQYKMPMVRKIRQHLDSLGLQTVPIWSCENSTWAYQPANSSYQTQEVQARSLIKRYVYNIDTGLEKLFWENLMEWFDYGGDPGSTWNSQGLIGDGMRNGEPPQNFNQPRVSYHAYKLLAQAIDVDKARYAGKMSVHQEPNLYAYRYVSLSSDSVARYILWRDSGSQSVTFHINTRRALITNMITDSLGNILQRDTVTADVQGNITFNVGIDPLLVKEISSTTSVEDEGENIPQEFLLYQNYPNPFNPSTTIRFEIPQHSHAILKVFDMLGREVKTLVNGELGAGEYSVQFDAEQLSSGIYFYQLKAVGFIQTRKMLITR